MASISPGLALPPKKERSKGPKGTLLAGWLAGWLGWAGWLAGWLAGLFIQLINPSVLTRENEKRAEKEGGRCTRKRPASPHWGLRKEPMIYTPRPMDYSAVAGISREYLNTAGNPECIPPIIS